jgi:prevent-host-death family protein
MDDKSSFNIYEAKTRLSELVERATRGEKVILMNRGEPVAMIIPLPRPQRQRRLGFLKGKGRLLKGWDQPIEDFSDYQ